jgi:hypothetical protein
LNDWKAGRLSDEQLRWWGLFMFVGAFPQEWSPTGWRLTGPIQEIDFDYSDDEAVNDAVFRIKEHRDFIDGPITSAELEELLTSLHAPPSG